MPRIRERLPYPRVRESNTGHKSTKGVNGRNSDNTLIQKYLHWEPSTPLRAGLERTYKWIYVCSFELDSEFLRGLQHVGIDQDR